MQQIWKCPECWPVAQLVICLALLQSTLAAVDQQNPHLRVSTLNICLPTEGFTSLACTNCLIYTPQRVLTTAKLQPCVRHWLDQCANESCT